MARSDQTRDVYDYDFSRNLFEAGLGPGLVIYTTPGGLGGGIQANIDQSRTEISPQVVIDALKSNPQWITIALTIISIYLIATRK